MKKNYKTPVFRAVFLSGKSSLMAGSGSKPVGKFEETSTGFEGEFDSVEDNGTHISD